MDNYIARFFVRNDETGLIEVWSLPCCIGDGHYAVGIDFIINEGFSRYGCADFDEAKEFLKQVENHYQAKYKKVPKLTIIKMALDVNILEF